MAAEIGVRHDPEWAEWVASLRQRYAGMKLIVGRDKLDEIQVCTDVDGFQTYSPIRFVGCTPQDPSFRAVPHEAPRIPGQGPYFLPVLYL